MFYVLFNEQKESRARTEIINNYDKMFASAGFDMKSN